MNVIGSLIIALSMYSRLPMPRMNWTKERMEYTFCFFPVVGLLIGAVYWLWYQAFLRFDLTPFLYGVVAALIPLFVAGGIHMDGFMDVTDARACYGSMEKRHEILKDPHTGAFAVMGVVTYLLLETAVFYELSPDVALLLTPVFVASRCLSGLSVVCWKKARSTGLAAEFSSRSKRQVTVLVLCVCLLSCMAVLWCLAGGFLLLFLTVAGGLVYGFTYWVSMKQFGGITGDLAGWLLLRCELAFLVAILLWEKWMWYGGLR